MSRVAQMSGSRHTCGCVMSTQMSEMLQRGRRYNYTHHTTFLDAHMYYTAFLLKTAPVLKSISILL